MNRAAASAACLLISLPLVGSLSARAADGPTCAAVRFGTVGWLDAGSGVSLASALLTGLGYQPLVQRLDAPTILASLKNRDLDAFLEILVPTMGVELKPYILDNSVELARRNLAGTKYTLAVNRTGAELGITDFNSVGDHGDALSWQIHGVEPGADGNLLIEDMIERNLHGLGRFTLVESSETEMLEAVAHANRERRPIVILGYEPHPMNVRFDLNYLAGGDDVFGPNFGGADAYTGVRASLPADCPNLSLFFGNLEFALPMINEVMTAILALKAQPLVAAVAWIREQPQVLEGWLEGVETIDGEPGLPAVRRFVGLPADG